MELLREGMTNPLISSGVEVSPIEAESQIVATGSTAAPKIEDGDAAGLGPTDGLIQARPTGIGGRRIAKKVHVERQKPCGHLTLPLVRLFVHFTQNLQSFFVRNSRNTAFSTLFVRQYLRAICHGINLSPKHFVQGNISDAEASNGSPKSIGTPHSFDVRNQGPIEVMHGHKDDGEVGLVGGQRFLEQPSRHACRVPRLAAVQHFHMAKPLFMELAFSGSRDAFSVFYAPSKDGRVSHEGDAVGVGAAIFRKIRSESIPIGGDPKVMGFPHPFHSVCAQIGRHSPLPHRVGSISGSHPRKAGANFGEAGHEQRHNQTHQQPRQGGAWFSRHAMKFSKAVSMMWMLVFLGGVANANVRLDIEVATPAGELEDASEGALTAHVRWLGEDKKVDLVPGEDGVWRGYVQGEQTRAVGIELWRHDGAIPLRLDQGLEVLSKGDNTIHWALTGPQPRSATRLSETRLPADMAQAEERLSMGVAFWLFLSCLAVLVLGNRAIKQPKKEAKKSEKSNVWREGLLWVIAGLVWTWPAALAGPGELVGRHFDALGTVWVIDAASRMGLGLHDPMSAWPNGITYTAIDSWLLLIVSDLLSWMDAVRIHGWLQVVGVATSGWAAAVFARNVGVAKPWHHLAGVLYAGSGLVGVALLEGHVYQAINPWLPLMGLSMWRVTSTNGRHRDGWMAGLFFGLCLFSSGYMGVSAAVLAVGLALPSLIRRQNLGPLAVAACLATLLGSIYIWLFSGVGQPTADHATLRTLQIGSLSLDNLGPPSLEVDRTGHSRAHAMSVAALAMAVLGWRLGVARARLMLGIVLGAVLIAMGPQWSLGVDPTDPSIPSPIGWLWKIDGMHYLRFPSRVLATPLLCIGVLAAGSLAAIADRMGRRVGFIVMGLLVLETVATVQLPLRQRVLPADVPAAYAQGEGPVFDMIGEGLDPNGEINAWFNGIVCLYQTLHHRPIADDCVVVEKGANPRIDMGRWMAARLYENDVGSVNRRLNRYGFTEVALHTDWLGPSDRIRMTQALSLLSPNKPPRRSGGVHIYTVGPASEGVEKEGVAQAIEGPNTDPVDWHMRLDLIVDRTVETARYFVTIVDVKGASHSVEIRDHGRWPGEKPNDGILNAHWMGTIQGPVAMSLSQIRNGERREIWSGSVAPLELQEDRLAFRLNDNEDAEPMLRALENFFPEVRNRGGKIIGLGWGGALCLIGLWCVRVRRDPIA